MSDRLPGTTWSNPIWHRGYRIFIDDCAGTHPQGYAYVHDDYDPTPVHSGDGPSDHRHGWERTLDQAKAALAHRSIATTLRYAHVLDDDVRHGLEAAESRNSPEAAESGTTKKGRFSAGNGEKQRA